MSSLYLFKPYDGSYEAAYDKAIIKAHDRALLKFMACSTNTPSFARYHYAEFVKKEGCIIYFKDLRMSDDCEPKGYASLIDTNRGALQIDDEINSIHSVDVTYLWGFEV